MLDPQSEDVPRKDREVTQILGAVTSGEEGASADLLPLVYGELLSSAP